MKTFFFFLLSCIVLLLPIPVQAQSTQSATTNITVTVAGNILSLTGYIAPFASVVLTINGTVITSTVADKNGNFSFINIAVPKSTSTICLDAVDFKKLGESQACITVTPVNGIISKTNVFLPPTLGLQRTEVFVGNNALAFGYSMPGAKVSVHFDNATGCTVIADATGYYQCTISIKTAGDHILFADAVLKGQPSEVQLKKILLKGLTIEKPSPTPQPLIQIPNLFAIPWWVWLILLLLLIILIIILLRKLRPDLIPKIGAPSISFAHAFDWLFKERKLHHHWMKGVGY